jgi:hypothetical protein
MPASWPLSWPSPFQSKSPTNAAYPCSATIRLRVSDYKQSGGHHVLGVRGKGGKERQMPSHPEAVERLEEWLAVIGPSEGRLTAVPPAEVGPREGADGLLPSHPQRLPVPGEVVRPQARPGPERDGAFIPGDGHDHGPSAGPTSWTCKASPGTPTRGPRSGTSATATDSAAARPT